jgi:uroporphyrinogen-III synthase
VTGRFDRGDASVTVPAQARAAGESPGGGTAAAGHDGSVDPDQPLSGITVGVTADRRAGQQIDLLRRRGAQVRWGPVLQSVDLTRHGPLLEVTASLVERPPDVLVLLTGQGTSWWLDAADGAGLGADLRRALGSTAILARGPKAASAARRAGLVVAWQAEREVVADVLDHLASVAPGRTVAVQLDGASDADTLDAVAALAGRAAVPVPVYRWELPADRAPAHRLVRAVVAGQVDAVTFTASPAVRHLAELAAELGLAAELDEAMAGRVRPVSVGPVCSATARDRGWRRIIEPERHRLVPMVDALVRAVLDGRAGPGG